MPVLLLMPGLPCPVHAQSYRSHLGGQVVYILIARIWVLRKRRRLLWEVAFLLRRCVVLRRRACVLIWRLTDRRTSTLLIARRTGRDRWPVRVRFVCPPGSIWVRGPCTHSVVHRELGHMCGAGPTRSGSKGGMSICGLSARQKSGESRRDIGSL
jgi:hypothetical protein